MGYLFTALAVLSGAAKGYFGKKTSGLITALSSAILFNAVRMLICVPIGLFAVFISSGSFAAAEISAKQLLIFLLSGISTSVFVVVWLLVIRRGAYMLVDVFLTAGVIIPIMLCAVFFGEPVRANHAAGMILLIISAYIMCSYNNKIREKLDVRAYALLILCGAANGLSSFSQKWFRYSSPDAGIPVFNLYTYMVSSLLLFIIWGAIRIRSGSSPRGGSVVGTKQTLMLGAYVSVMSVCIFLNTLFSTAAAGILPAAELYPLMQGGGLSVSMLMSHFLFREKINVRCVIGVILTFVSLLMINLIKL